MESGNAFIHLVRQMRQVQKSYFKSHGPMKSTFLNQSKKLEKQVDEYLRAYARKDAQEFSNR